MWRQECSYRLQAAHVSAAVCSLSLFKMAKITDVTQLTKLVRVNSISLDCRHREYKLAERKPAVWNRIGDAMNCDRGKSLVYVAST